MHPTISVSRSDGATMCTFYILFCQVQDKSIPFKRTFQLDIQINNLENIKSQESTVHYAQGRATISVPYTTG